MTDDIEPLSDAELERVIHDHRPKFAYQSNKVDDLTKVCHACRPRHNEMLTLAPRLEWQKEQDGFFTPPRFKWTTPDHHYQIWGRDESYAVAISRGRLPHDRGWSITNFAVARDLPSLDAARSLAEKLNAVLSPPVGPQP